MPDHNRKSILLALLFLLSAAVSVSAQGWGSGARVFKGNAPAKAPPAKAQASSKKEVTRAKVSQAPKVATRNSSTAKTQPQIAKTADANNAAKTVAAKTGRERRVAETKGANTSDANAIAAAKSPEVKNAESVRIGYASGSKSGRCDPEQDQRTDLSGSYVGKVTYPNSGLSGDATLTINGNRFTLRNGSRTETGNITAVTTCTYTAVAMMFGEWRTPQPGEPAEPPLPMLSLRAIRQGDRLTLKASPSERLVFSFEPGPDR